MDIYESEMYRFLTEPHNFKNMLRVLEQFKPVRKQLIREFYAEVKTELGKKIEGKEWVIRDNWHEEFSPHWGILLTKAAWKRDKYTIFALSWEGFGGHPYYGAWINLGSKFPQNKHSISKVQNAKKWQGLRKGGSGSWWPVWQYGPLKLDRHADLESILPQFRSQQARIHAEMLWELAQKIGPIYDEAIQSYPAEVPPVS